MDPSEFLLLLLCSAHLHYDVEHHEIIIDGALTCISGLDGLRPEDRAAVEQLLDACRGEAEVPAAPPTTQSQDDTPAKGGKKRKVKENDVDDVAGATPAKAAKAAASVLTADQLAAIADARAKLASRNGAWLGAALAKNGLPKSGRKDDLVDRVAECQVLGVPPTCTLCSKKKLSWSKVTGKYSCPGYFDDEEKVFKRCKGPGDEVVIQRTPWEEL